ncbi:AI-2E family transporter, partial [Corynebacterium testudinoris]|nr:AI-2E family transporter [Corynebacterium testudinoris]
KAMNLHAAVVLLSVTVGSTMFGIVGAFLAVPVAATIAVWFRYHSEMVALRAGEISIDDIEIATKEGTNVTSKEAFEGVRDKLRSMGRRRNEDSAEGKSESGGILPRFRKVVETEPE